MLPLSAEVPAVLLTLLKKLHLLVVLLAELPTPRKHLRPLAVLLTLTRSNFITSKHKNGQLAEYFQLP